ncbi:MAG: hypothetical protein FWH20_07995 [Oscillospiraceae bacterium]|nr:hypothetical protein [Oscillospiraceae bacterium]
MKIRIILAGVLVIALLAGIAACGTGDTEGTEGLPEVVIPETPPTTADDSQGYLDGLDEQDELDEQDFREGGAVNRVVAHDDSENGNYSATEPPEPYDNMPYYDPHDRLDNHEIPTFDYPYDTAFDALDYQDLLDILLDVANVTKATVFEELEVMVLNLVDLAERYQANPDLDAYMDEFISWYENSYLLFQATNYLTELFWVLDYDLSDAFDEELDSLFETLEERYEAYEETLDLFVDEYIASYVPFSEFTLGRQKYAIGDNDFGRLGVEDLLAVCVDISYIMAAKFLHEMDAFADSFIDVAERYEVNPELDFFADEVETLTELYLYYEDVYEPIEDLFRWFVGEINYGIYDAFEYEFDKIIDKLYPYYDTAEVLFGGYNIDIIS